MARFRKVANRAGQVLPPRVRTRAKAAGKAMLDSMPDSVESRLRTAFGRKGQVRELGPADPLGLEVRDGRPKSKAGLSAGAQAGTQSGGNSLTAGKRALTGRAAGAGSGSRQGMSDRLYRALHGTASPSRTVTGGRPVAGIVGPDLRSALEAESHCVVPFMPGTCEAAATRSEVILIDLAAFTGAWGGALDAAGVALYDELETAIDAAAKHGITTWVVVRGSDTHRLGSLQLRRLDSVEVIDPTEAREREHFTEDAGEDASEGIIDIVRGLGAAA